MKKALAIGGGVVVLAVVGFVGVVALQPAETHVVRSATFDATADDVAPLLTDLRLVNTWSPWTELDPDMDQSYSETTDQVGSWYRWDGNDDVGAGTQTITAIEEGRVTQELAFERPFESEGVVHLDWVEQDDQVTVHWSMTSPNGFMSKAVGLFMDMDALIGADFEKGLGYLEPRVAEAKATREAEEEAARLAAAEDEATEDDAPPTP